MGMVLTGDVRQYNRKTFQFNLYKNYYNDPDRLVEEVYMKED